MTKVRYIDKPEIEGWANEWNPHGLGEVILWFEDGSATSEEARLLEPVEGSREEWHAAMDRREP